MRNKDATAVLLNHYILPGMELSSDSMPTYKATNYADPERPAEGEWCVRFRSPNVADEFRKAYMEALQANDRLRKAGQ
jgi:hypothetical protein